MPLSGLDDVAWAKLSHAYGKAKDVPDLLRALTSSASKERADAIFRLGASLCHQGTLYSATAPAVPFLLALLASPKVKDRSAILALLPDIATLDDVGPLLLDGAPAKLTGLPAAFTKAVEAVRGGTNVYLELLTAKEPDLRARRLPPRVAAGRGEDGRPRPRGGDGRRRGRGREGHLRDRARVRRPLAPIDGRRGAASSSAGGEGPRAPHGRRHRPVAPPSR